MSKSHGSIPAKVQDFVGAVKHLGWVNEMGVGGEKLKKHFLKNFPHSAHYNKPPEIRKDIAKGRWVDSETGLSLLQRKDGKYELF